MSVSIVDSNGFTKFMSDVDPNFQLPCYTTYSDFFLKVTDFDVVVLASVLPFLVLLTLLIETNCILELSVCSTRPQIDLSFHVINVNTLKTFIQYLPSCPTCYSKFLTPQKHLQGLPFLLILLILELCDFLIQLY